MRHWLLISDAVSKHNERNPGKEVVYLNYAAVDPDADQQQVRLLAFPLDADTSMKMEALTTLHEVDQKPTSRTSTC